jgi:hypothetical protein
MLDKTDIANRLTSLRYNQFLFLPTPHPMILWITLLYHREHGPRWLPCYLDLKTPQGQAIARTLAQTGKYWILFFALEGTQKCDNVITVSIPSNQCKMLEDSILPTLLRSRTAGCLGYPNSPLAGGRGHGGGFGRTRLANPEERQSTPGTRVCQSAVQRDWPGRDARLARPFLFKAGERAARPYPGPRRACGGGWRGSSLPA